MGLPMTSGTLGTLDFIGTSPCPISRRRLPWLLWLLSWCHGHTSRVSHCHRPRVTPPGMSRLVDFVTYPPFEKLDILGSFPAPVWANALVSFTSSTWTPSFLSLGIIYCDHQSNESWYLANVHQLIIWTTQYMYRSLIWSSVRFMLSGLSISAIYWCRSLGPKSKKRACAAHSTQLAGQLSNSQSSIPKCLPVHSVRM